MNKLILLVFWCILLNGCEDHTSQTKKTSITLSKRLSKEKIYSSDIQIPSTMTPVKTRTVANQVGSVQAPTINGGIINSANTSQVTSLIIELQPTPTPSKKTQNPILDKPTPVSKEEEKWVDAKRVKRLLEKAAQDGKLSIVLNEVNKRGLPSSVATIPIIESHFNSNAISSKGAAGDWQIMPALAKDYQLSEHERFNFAKSSQVALAHLASLYATFHNWEFAFAAYNAGSGRVTKALQKNPHAQSVEELSLPRETKQYIKKLKAINEMLMELP